MDLFYQLPLVLQLLIKALLVVAVLMGLCLYGSLAERKVSADQVGVPQIRAGAAGVGPQSAAVDLVHHGRPGGGRGRQQGGQKRDAGDRKAQQGAGEACSVWHRRDSNPRRGGVSRPSSRLRTQRWAICLGSLKTQTLPPWVTWRVSSAMSPPHSGTAPP